MFYMKSHYVELRYSQDRLQSRISGFSRGCALDRPRLGHSHQFLLFFLSKEFVYTNATCVVYN